MRADKDHAVGNSVESSKDESKPHKCPEEKWEDAELKISENRKNDNNVCEMFFDTRNGDEWDKENDGNHSCGDSNEAGEKLRDNSHDIVAKRDSLKKVDPVIYMDKNVTACDLPEIVVCYKEKTYQVVKDICVDEGVPVQEKFLFSEKDSVRCNSNSNSNSNQCESEVLVKADKGNANALETKSSEDKNGKLDDSELCNDPDANRDVKESSREGFADAEGSSYCNQLHSIVTREAKDSPTHGLSLSEISHDIESDENWKDEVATLENISLTLGDILSREDEQKQKPLNNSNNSDRREEQSPPQLQEKGKRSLETTALQTELEETEEPEKAEEKLTSVSTTSQEPNRTFNDPERPETDNQQPNLLVENSLEDNKLFPSGFGETSFSAAEPVSISGHITYSGTIAFSGSLSVRSDASTTSGRSFAFPILQSEWNSSPVRMAKTNKRRQKGWRHILLCCRFS